MATLMISFSRGTPGGHTIRGDQGHLMLGEHVASQSEVNRAIVSGYSPCHGVPAPRVTFLAETPAWWKVLSVIWVAGSPTDCAQIDPTISPGWTAA